MNDSPSRPRLLVGALLAVTALLAFSAAGASASVPAHWVNPGSISASGTLTLKQNGANEKSCKLGVNSGEAVSFEQYGAMWIENPSYGVALFSCPSSTLYMRIAGATNYETSYFLTVEGGGSLPGPYGTYTPDTWNATWTNAAGGSPSTLSFSNTKIGHNGGGNITATGTLTVKRTNGENITLTH